MGIGSLQTRYLILASVKQSSRKKVPTFLLCSSFPFWSAQKYDPFGCVQIYFWSSSRITHTGLQSVRLSFRPGDEDIPQTASTHSSNLNTSSHCRCSCGSLLWPRSHEGSKPEICHAPETAVPVRLMFYKAAWCSGFPYYCGCLQDKSCHLWGDLGFNKPLDYWVALPSLQPFLSWRWTCTSEKIDACTVCWAEFCGLMGEWTATFQKLNNCLKEIKSRWLKDQLTDYIVFITSA